MKDFTLHASRTAIDDQSASNPKHKELFLGLQNHCFESLKKLHETNCFNKVLLS